MLNTENDDGFSISNASSDLEDGEVFEVIVKKRRLKKKIDKELNKMNDYMKR